MIEGTPNEWDHVTIDAFLAQDYPKESYEIPIAYAIPRYCAAFEIALDQIKDKPLSWLLDRDQKTFHGFRNGLIPNNGSSPEYKGNLDYMIGLNMGVAVRIQETLKRE